MEINKLQIGVATVVPLMLTAVAWGAYGNRVTQLEKQLEDQRREQIEQQKDIQQLSQTIIRIDVQYSEIIRRLNRIEGAVKRSD